MAVSVKRELLSIENKFAAIATIAKHARRLRDIQNLDKAEKQGLVDYVHGRVAVDVKTLPEFLRRDLGDEGMESAGHKAKKKKSKKKSD